MNPVIFEHDISLNPEGCYKNFRYTLSKHLIKIQWDHFFTSISLLGGGYSI